jgi:hypothetical protein
MKHLLIGFFLGLACFSTASDAQTVFAENAQLTADGFVCQENGQNKYYLHDYYASPETLSLAPYDVDKIPGDYKTKARAVIERIRRFDPMAADAYIQMIDGFEGEVSLLEQTQINRRTMFSQPLKPQKCARVPVAIHKLVPRTLEMPFLISKEFWTGADATHKAGLALKLILLRETGQITRYYWGTVNQTQLRKEAADAGYFLNVISSPDFSGLDIMEYARLLREGSRIGSEYLPKQNPVRHVLEINGKKYWALDIIVADDNSKFKALPYDGEDSPQELYAKLGHHRRYYPAWIPFQR